jgi:hypothetical protein
MTTIPPATGLSEDEKEYNWTTMLPIIIFTWFVIGLMICHPTLFIRCCQLVCPKRRSEDLSTSDKEKPASWQLADKIAQDIEALDKDSGSNTNTPNTSTNIRNIYRNVYAELQDDPLELTQRDGDSDINSDKFKPITPKSRSLGVNFRR